MDTESFAILMAVSILGGWVIGIATAELGDKWRWWRHQRRLARLERERLERFARDNQELREFLERIYGKRPSE